MGIRIGRFLPHALKDALKRVYWRGADVVNYLRGRSENLVPPGRLIFIGAGDYKEVGDEFLKYFVEFGQLRPSDRVLDVGCGIGRMARPLTRYLSDAGGYEGFDVVGYGIDWCRHKITPRFPNFRFQVADVYHEFYNLRGRQKASAYRFPFPDESFDFVFATSLFTHLFLPETRNYLAEIARVLKVGRRSLTTFFLLNADSERLIGENRGEFRFAHAAADGCRFESEATPNYAVAYPEEVVRRLFADNGLAVVEPIHYGRWCGREPALSLQDIVVSVRG